MKKIIILLAVSIISSSCMETVTESTEKAKVEATKDTAPVTALDYTKRGVKEYKDGNTDAALADFNKAVELDPNYSDAYLDKAIINMDKRNYIDALADLNEAVKANPKNDLAYYNRAICFDALESYEKAAENFGKVIELSSKESAVDYNNRAISYAKQNLSEKALADFAKALEIDPKCHETYYNRGDLYQNMDENDKALADYNKAIELKPDYLEAYFNRGTLYFGGGIYDKALEDFSKSIEIDPNLADAYNWRADIFIGQKQYNKAAEDLRKTITLSSDFLDAYENLLELLVILNKPAEFADTLEKFNKTFPVSKLDTFDLTLKQYFICIKDKLNNQDTTENDKLFDKLLKEDFQSEWSTDDMTEWLNSDKNPLSKEQKDYIITITTKLDNKLNNPDDMESLK